MNLSAEAAFRIAEAIAYFGGWIGVRLYFQQKLGVVEKGDRRHEVREKIGYALVSLAAVPVLLYVVTPWLDLAHVDLPSTVRWVAVAATVAGSALLIWTHAVLGRNWSGVLELSKDHALVTEGPYRVVRHPMYSAFFLMAFGLLLSSANWVVGGGLIGSVAFMYFTRVADEERMMQDRFGQAYLSYMARTGRVLPKP